MNCGHEECTGVHSSHGKGPKCPTYMERQRIEGRERMRRLREDPEFRRRANARLAEQRRTEAYRAKKRDRYWSLSGYQYNRLMMKRRRTKALARMRQRHTAEEV